jgi:hypothetical protein
MLIVFGLKATSINYRIQYFLGFITKKNTIARVVVRWMMSFG